MRPYWFTCWCCRNGGIEGKRRIKRHLWRMCFAMWVASRVPELMRYPLLFPIPVLAPIGVMLYWFWRPRGKRPVRGVAMAARSDQAMEASI